MMEDDHDSVVVVVVVKLLEPQNDDQKWRWTEVMDLEATSNARTISTWLMRNRNIAMNTVFHPSSFL